MRIFAFSILKLEHRFNIVAECPGFDIGACPRRRFCLRPVALGSVDFIRHELELRQTFSFKRCLGLRRQIEPNLLLNVALRSRDLTH
jgi:hypothetical protein